MFTILGVFLSNRAGSKHFAGFLFRCLFCVAVLCCDFSFFCRFLFSRGSADFFFLPFSFFLGALPFFISAVFFLGGALLFSFLRFRFLFLLARILLLIINPMKMIGYAPLRNMAPPKWNNKNRRSQFI